MFWVHYRLLNRELGERVAAENELRKLSVRLMRVRDEESRKFARELHDGLGQNLVAAKLTADSLQNEEPENGKLKELCAVLQDCVSQTRTISYLLHPPMLDEMGFGSAAQWFIEGYAQRTGVAVSSHISPEAEHLPRDLELTLFRILQEALTNIHRHSKSEKVDVSVSTTSQEVMLIVRDYGSGIPADVLTDFKTTGAHVGVGLAGMKERVRELHGELEILSDAAGTQIEVRVPMMAERELSATGAA
jgi:two-component system NarL family sensor kinase